MRARVSRTSSQASVKDCARPLAPLDQRHGVLDRRVEVQVVQLEPGARLPQPVRVDVHQRHRSPVHPGEHEGRAGDGAGDAEPGADALRERGLAGAERAGEHHDVAGPQPAREPAAEGPGRLQVGQLLRHGEGELAGDDLDGPQLAPAPVQVAGGVQHQRVAGRGERLAGLVGAGDPPPPAHAAAFTASARSSASSRRGSPLGPKRSAALGW